MKLPLRDVTDALIEGLQVIDTDWRYVYLNPPAVAHARHSLEDLLGRTMMECYPGIEQTDMFATLRTCMEEREPSVLFNEFTYPDGHMAHFELHVEPVPQGIAVLSLDITERVQRESRLAQLAEREATAEKMRAVAMLAGGVAHDLGNMLHAVLAYAALLDEHVDAPQASDHLARLTDAANRAAAVSRRLSDLGSIRGVAPISLVEPVESVCDLLRRSLGRDVELRFVQPPPLPEAIADRAGVDRALVNLITNANHAVDDGGTITVELDEVVLAPEAVELIPSARPGRYVRLSVHDDGCGMDEQTRRRAVEPFFTTKGEQGTGFGLANVYAMMQESGGHLWLYSEPGIGTSVKLYFPAADELPVPPPALGPPKTDGSILVVDNDETIRQLMVRTLTAAGYQVEEAALARDALRAVQADPPAAIVCDVVLPDVRGPALIEQIRQRVPAIRVLWVSGYSRQTAPNTLILTPGSDFLGKPFGPRDLLDKLEKLLG